MKRKKVNNMSVEEMRIALQEMEEQEKELEQRQKLETAYIKRKDTRIDDLMAEGQELALMITRFKAKVHATMDLQATDLSEYGKVRSDSKGGFQVTHSDNRQRIIRRRDTDPVWDERAEKAVELMTDFLGDKIKKRDVKTYNILMGFLARNKKGALEYAKVMSLIQYEKYWDDPRWTEGLRLIKEGYTLTFKAFGYEFKTIDTYGKWESLNLNFASV